MLTKIYLTIDDSPSVHMDKKVDFLIGQNISAIFYARGEYISKHPDQIIYAINNGFLIGNHSYTHPYFSEIPLAECIDEIIRTEKLIDQCYSSADRTRPCKIVRLPFADRGAGAKAKEAKSEPEKTKVQELQYFLKKNNFKTLNFQPINSFLDSYWDWDTEDYKTKHISDQRLYLMEMKKFFEGCKKDTAVILLHDFDNNHHLFEASMNFLLDRKVEFLNYHISKELR
jgi:peptidoglycan-N-acetylglucosamine deacetylase